MTVPGVSRARPESCLSDLALERVLVGEAIPAPERVAIEHHLSSCPTCRARRDELAAAPAQTPDPLFWKQKDAAARVWPRRLMVGVAGVAALAAGLALVARPRTGDDRAAIADGARAKGDGLALTVVARRADGRRVPVFDGTVLRPGDAVRFQLNTRGAGQAAVLGLDSAGRVSLYAPEAPGPALAVAAGTIVLPGSVVLDETPGEERFVALLCGTMPAPAALEAAGRRALAAAGGVPARAPRLDLPCRQDALTIRKDAGR